MFKSLAKKKFSFIKQNSLIISVLIVITAFLFSRLPFFIWAPIVGSSYDTFEYFEIVEQLNNGILPSISFLPVGFPFFCYFIGLFSDNILTIIYIQNFITLIISLFFIFVVNKYYKKIVVFISIALSIYLMDSFKLNIDTHLYTESIYSNSILLICGLFICLINSKNKWTWIFFSISLIFPSLIRSNGIYIYFLPLFILLFMIFNKYHLKFYFLLLLPILLLNILWGLYSIKVDGIFSIANSKRINYVIDYSQHYRLGDKKLRDKKISSTGYLKDKSILLGKYINNISVSKAQFYYSIIPTRYNKLFIQDKIHKPDLMMDLKTKEWISLKESIRELVYKDYFYKTDPFKSIILEFNVKNKYSNLWLFLYHIYYKIHDIFFWNIFWFILSLIIFIYTSVLLIKNKFNNKIIFLINSLCLLHFIAIITITIGHGRFQARYSHVTEFVYYLIPVFFILFLHKTSKKNHKKIQKI